MRSHAQDTSLSQSMSRLFFATLTLLPEIRALTYQAAAPPNVDLSSLGRIALAGNWDSISLYSYVGQGEGTVNTNGSQSILGRFPSGTFYDLQSTDAYISTMCPWILGNGTLGGVIIGGNFTDLGGQAAQGMALYNPNNNTVTPLAGLTGQVNSVYCDNDNQVVYVGGSFSGGNSTNAIAWSIDSWANLPFLGFDGPVDTIARLPNGHIAFGGTFQGTGTEVMPTVLDAQVINVGSANVSALASSTQQGFNDPRNIICKNGNQTGAGNEWLLPDNSGGIWQAEFGFGFRPSKLRLYNSQVAGYGTRAWRFVTENNSAIMAFTYTNKTTGQKETCSAFCPLEQAAGAQDFYFVNQIGMDSFSIDIREWYGNGGGLGGIELFQNDIYSYAVESFNEPACQTVSTTASSVTTTGPWTVHPSMDASSSYLSADLAQGSANTDLSVVFFPDIKQSGHYSVTIDTPGCLGDSTCETRGQVNITGQMGSGSGTPTAPVSVQLWQTNDYDKYDQIYYGYVDTTETAFRPSITLTPVAGQDRALTIVAQRVNFKLVSSASGLNGLFEFDPTSTNNNTNFTTSTVDQVGNQLGSGATVAEILVVSNTTYVAGSFQTNGYSNIMAMSNGGNATALPGNGLNDAVQGMYQNGTHLFVAGNFTNVQNGNVAGLNSIAAYSIAQNSWSPLGAGVNGPVDTVVPITMNTSNGAPLDCIAFSGYFNQINAYGRSQAAPVNNIALWVPAMNDWLNNLNEATISITGALSAYTNVTGFGPLYAGAVNSQTLGISGAAALTGSGAPTLEQLPIDIQASSPAPSSANGKRAVEREVIDGCVTGTFYEQNGLNITMLAGHFTATATNGSQVANLAFINGTANNTVTGINSDRLPADAVVLALDTTGTTLVAGGSDTSGIIVYDLATASLAAIQPPELTGGSSVWSVNTVAAQPSSSAVYVGGSFASAGSLPCPALCIWNTASQQWTAPAFSAAPLNSTSVITSLTWVNPTQLLLAGNMTFGPEASNYTTLASYDTTTSTFTPFPNAGNSAQVPGQVSAFTATDASYTSLYAAGTSNTNASSFLAHFSSTTNTWTAISGLSPESVIYGLQTLTTQTDHANSITVSPSQVLLVSGSLSIPAFGNVSAVLFNGTDWTPFLLSTLTSGGPGSVRRTFVQNPSGFLTPTTGRNTQAHLAKGYVVLISLAIALALIFIMVVAGILVERWRRRKEGYAAAPTSMGAQSEKAGLSADKEKRKSMGPPQLPPIGKGESSFGGGILGR